VLLNAKIAKANPAFKRSSWEKECQTALKMKVQKIHLQMFKISLSKPV